MMRWAGPALLLAVAATAGAAAQRPTVSVQSFVGTWVGTQSWAIDAPPPGSNSSQPVAITIREADGVLSGTLTPFMGGYDGATFTNGRVVGDELVAEAGFGSEPLDPALGIPAPAIVADEDSPAVAAGAKPVAARARTMPAWKEATKVRFVFKADGVDLKGTADITMADAPWLSFTYTLSKKRARY